MIKIYIYKENVFRRKQIFDDLFLHKNIVMIFISKRHNVFPNEESTKTMS